MLRVHHSMLQLVSLIQCVSLLIQGLPQTPSLHLSISDIRHPSPDHRHCPPQPPSPASPKVVTSREVTSPPTKMDRRNKRMKDKCATSLDTSGCATPLNTSGCATLLNTSESDTESVLFSEGTSPPVLPTQSCTEQRIREN